MNLTFKWKSFRTLCSLFVIFSSGLTSCFILNHQLSLGPLTARNIIGVIFFSCCCSIAVLLFRISMKWRMLMVKFMKTESMLKNKEYKMAKSKWSLRKRLFIMTVVYLTLAMVEHGFFFASEMSQVLIEVEVCDRHGKDLAEIYITKHLKFIIDRLPLNYNHFLGFFLEYLNFSYTLYWNFLDLIIILFSMGIAILYEKINWRLKNLQTLFVNETTWAEIRYHHVQVSELITIVNENINELIILACFNDGYFILSQAINITKWVLKT